MSEPLRWLRDPARRLDRVLFLDRDGVINEHIRDGYVLAWSDFRWRPGIAAALRDASAAGLPLVVVTNQSCIGRGLVEEARVVDILTEMTRLLERDGVELAGWYCCPHAPDEHCGCRKPLPGMLQACSADTGAELAASFLIGDSDSDVAAALAVGARAWMVREPEDMARAVAEIGRAASGEPAGSDRGYDPPAKVRSQAFLS